MKNLTGSKIYFLLIFLSFSCSDIKKAELKPNEYITWFESNYEQFVEKRDIEDITYTLTYLPEDYLFAKQYIGDIIKKDVYTQDNDFFTMSLRISCLNGKIQEYKVVNESDYQKREDYFSYEIYKDIYVIQNGKKITSSNVFYQSGRGLSPYIDLLIHFNTKLLDNDFQIQYEDKIFGTGKINFYFKHDIITKRPILKI